MPNTRYFEIALNVLDVLTSVFLLLYLISFWTLEDAYLLESVDIPWEDNFITWREIVSLKSLPSVGCRGGGQWVNLYVYIRRCVLPLLAPDCNCLWKHLVKIQISWNQSLSQSFHGTCQVVALVLKVQGCMQFFFAR